MATSAHADEHTHEGSHRPIWHYVVIAAVLTLLTFIEIGPLFEWYHLPGGVLLALSAVKFFLVVAFFMHLWDDAPIYTRLFAAPLVGAGLMVMVLMLLHNTFSPAPGEDPFAVQERYRSNWNYGCASWLRSHATNRWYCASGLIEPGVPTAIDPDRVAMASLKGQAAAAGEAGPTVDLSALGPDEQRQWLMSRGEEVYLQSCAACHQANGQGVPPAFPPLAGSMDYMGDPQNHARIIVHGLSGPIEVQGVAYNGAMPPQGMLSDLDIAAVATYERNSWGNEGSVVMPADVAAVR